MTPESLYSQLAAKLKVPALRPDAQGRVTLDFVDGPPIVLAIPARGQLYAEAELERLPARPSDTEALMRRLMGRSLGTLRERPEVLALDSAGQRLILYRRFDIDTLSFADFEADFEADTEAGFEFEVEMITLAIRGGWAIEWVPIPTIYEDQGSHIRPGAHVTNFLRVAWAARQSVHRPLEPAAPEDDRPQG